MAAVGSRAGKTAPPPRKPSPVRGGQEEELTFRQKLDEIKRQRSAGVAVPPATATLQSRMSRPEEPVVAKQVQTLTGMKTFLTSFGDWVEVVSAKSGKVYYYNKRTMVNQWNKPDEWLAEEVRLNPPLPETIPAPPAPPLPAEQESVPPPPPPEIQSEPLMNNNAQPPSKIKMKLKKNVMATARQKLKRLAAAKRKKEQEEEEEDSHLPLAYQKNAPTNQSHSSSDSDEEEEDAKKRKLALADAFGDDDDNNESTNKLAKLEPKDEIGHIDVRLPPPLLPVVSHSSGALIAPPPLCSEPPPQPAVFRKFDPTVAGPERVLALHQGSAAALAFQNITKVPEAQALFGPQAVPPPLSAASTLGNPTYFTEYNLPCCLKRCKFPKEQDVLHELKINKQKRRNFAPPPLMAGLDPKLAHLAEEAEMEQFYLELKNYNNHDRLLTTRMAGTLVYKVPDDVWDRYFHKFQIKIFSGVFLECKPSGYTHNDELIYSRTGKVCGRQTFPEDEVRCQAVLQAWKKDYCLCVYANKTFKVRRDNRLWERDLEEVREFLERNGY